MHARFIAVMVLVACGRPAVEPPDPEIPPDQPVLARMHRLTEAEYRTSVGQLLGVDVQAELPVDYRLHGFTTVGGAELSIAPADLEQYEASAWEIASRVLPDPAARDLALSCALDQIPDPEACIAPWALDLARQAWRRPLDQQDLDHLVGVFSTIDANVGDRMLAARAVVALVLQSPWFLFRIEVGTPDPSDADLRHLTDHEVAARTATLLTGGLPDAALSADADAGRLDPARLADHARRLLDEPEAHGAIGRFAHELLDLGRLEDLTKDEALFPDFTPTLRAAMAEEIRALFVDVVLTADEDLTALWTGRRAWVTPELARHYGLVEPGGWTELPEDQARGGVLGRAGFLALNAHQATTSPTHRGLFVRTRLLCGIVPAPPAGVNTELAEPEPGISLRERLALHRTAPQCAGCHAEMDPIGLAFEQFDATGAWRSHDNGVPVDASGELDGVVVDGVAELSRALAEHPDVPSCLTRQWLRHALGQSEGETSEHAIAELTGELADAGYRLRELLVAIVTHPAFRTVTVPAGAVGSCAPRVAGPEQCSGVDDDCDGEVDEAVRTCEGERGWGVETCVGGAWTGRCEERLPDPEVCNGVDDDGDGGIDEGLSVDLLRSSWDALEEAHPACTAPFDTESGACRAAIHRTCGASPCSFTGFGLVAIEGGEPTLGCVDENKAEALAVDYAVLASQHPVCDGVGERQGPHCNAAIHRYCRSVGYTTGFGPVENSGTTAHLMCEPTTTVRNTTYTEVAPFGPSGLSCDGVAQRWGEACAQAIHGWCRDRGFETGHGPLENSGDDLTVGCLGTVEAQ